MTFFKSIGQTQKDVARALKGILSRQVVSTIFNDINEPTGETIMKICQVYTTLNYTFVMTGKEEMKSETLKHANGSEVLQKENEMLNRLLESKEREIETLKSIINKLAK